MGFPQMLLAAVVKSASGEWAPCDAAKSLRRVIPAPCTRLHHQLALQQRQHLKAALAEQVSVFAVSALEAMWRNCVRLARRGLGRGAVLRPDPTVSRCGVVRGLSPAAPCSSLWNSVTWFSQARQSKDYALPNSSWSQGMMDLYSRFLEMCKDGTWKRIPSYSNSADHIPESLKLMSEKERKETRLFPRNMDTEGVGFEYAMFLNPSEKRMVCLFQPGPYLEGHSGFAHGGSTATIIDSTIGSCATFVAGRVMTANLSINYRNPIPLGSVVLVDSKVDQVEGRKVFLSCHVRSLDGQTLHAEATALFIRLDSTKSLQQQMSCQ